MRRRVQFSYVGTHDHRDHGQTPGRLSRRGEPMPRSSRRWRNHGTLACVREAQDASVRAAVDLHTSAAVAHGVGRTGTPLTPSARKNAYTREAQRRP